MVGGTLFIEGERTGRFRPGTDRLLAYTGDKSRISFEDFAVALADDLEPPAHLKARFTVDY